MTEYDDLYPGDEGRAITSTANPRVKGLIALRKRRLRDTQGVCLVEGYDELALALDAGGEPRVLFWCPPLVTGTAQRSLVATVRRQGVEVVSLGEQAFARASYRETPDGLLAVLANPDRPLDSLSVSARPLVLVTESVEKPGNLGAMLRTADAAGVEAVIAASPVTDWGNPNVVRASKGTVFAVNVASATTEETIAWLRRTGLAVVVATPDADALVGDVDLNQGIAIVVGAEHAGVSDAWRAAADHRVRIPMSGRVNSLNVATSAAIVVYEAVRQRASVGQDGDQPGAAGPPAGAVTGALDTVE